MPNLPVISGEKTIKTLRKLDFEVIRQRGSHVILKKSTEEETIGCVVPMHKALGHTERNIKTG